MADEKNRDQLLYPDTYVYMANEGKNGLVSVYVGPGVVNQTGQDKPVVYDPATRNYRSTDSIGQAVQKFLRAEEGDYIILENPADIETGNSGQKIQPFPGNAMQQAAALSKGRKIVIPGPWSNALWPGQSAKVVQGHRLRTNQFLVVAIYNEEEARHNWCKAIVKATTPTSSPGPVAADESQFAVGRRIIIKGSGVAFYIPPTGVEVVPDENDKYVRDAVTLEQLEYCILVDENGKKRFPRGPAVIFPEPTENFVSDAEGNRKFRALELNSIQGLHIKITEGYEEAGKHYDEGEEIFFTGKDQSIYYLRPEHSIISYGNNNLKHYSTAIPAGEGRYVMNRDEGDVELVVGPKMLLPDPRSEVIVRRILSRQQSELWYPGNQEAIQYNENLRQMMANSPSARSGFVSEGDYQKGTTQQVDGLEIFDRGPQAKMLLASAGPTNVAGQKFVRGQTYTPPRQITLDTKYDGVPAVNIWTGYACQIVSKSNNRRVEVGPKNVLLEYDETLEVLTLSTGKPKTTDKLYKTVYLQVKNNKVSDVIDVETADHVPVNLKISLCVNFEGDSGKWFDVENYVKYLTDHVRSILKGVVKRKTVEDFYANYLPIIRDAVLGAKVDGKERDGLFFAENNMRVMDVEVLDVALGNPEIAKMLQGLQYDIVQQNISVQKLRKKLEVTEVQEGIAVKLVEVEAITKRHKMEIEGQLVKQTLELELAKIQSELEQVQYRQSTKKEEEALVDIANSARLARMKAQADQDNIINREKAQVDKTKLEAETEAAVKRLEASRHGIAEALVALGREEVLVKVAEAVRIDTFLSGSSMEGAISRLFAGLPFAQQIFEKVRSAVDNDNGHGNRLKPPVPVKS